MSGRACAVVGCAVAIVGGGVALGAAPRTAAPSGAARRNAECEACHEDVAASWRGSMHRQSFTGADFASAFAREPREFCRSCHAPHADPTRGTKIGELERIGVGCVTCHVAAPHESRPDDPHAGLRPAANDPSSACAGCHEFGFPDAPDLLMQSTLLEHARSPAAQTSCIDCHMPRSDALGGRRDHGFSASRDVGMLRRAVAIEAERVAPERVRIRLAPREVGHAFPTGDMFRRVLVSAQAYDGQHLRVGDVEVIGRSFEDGARGAVDTRLGADGDFSPRDLELVLPGAAGLVVRWSVVYQRTDGARMVEGEPWVFESVTIEQGELSGS